MKEIKKGMGLRDLLTNTSPIFSWKRRTRSDGGKTQKESAQPDERIPGLDSTVSSLIMWKRDYTSRGTKISRLKAAETYGWGNRTSCARPIKSPRRKKKKQVRKLETEWARCDGITSGGIGSVA